MTREEAIDYLYDIKTDAIYRILSEEKDAIDMAIRSLEAWDSVIDELYQLQESGSPSLVVTMRTDHLINLIKRYLKEV